MKKILLICLTTSIVFAGCKSPQPLAVHPITYRDIMIIPAGSRIIFPESHPVNIGQVVEIGEFTTDRQCVLFSKDYTERIIQLTIEGLE
jgi:hypothetical protein